MGIYMYSKNGLMTIHMMDDCMCYSVCMNGWMAVMYVRMNG